MDTSVMKLIPGLIQGRDFNLVSSTTSKTGDMVMGFFHYR